MSRVMFYFDKECIEKASEKLKEIFMQEGISGVPVYTSYSKGRAERTKEWICYDLSNNRLYQASHELNDKVNDIVRNFDWESIGVTGFEEKSCATSEENEVEIKLLGLREIPVTCTVLGKVTDFEYFSANESTENIPGGDAA